MQVCRRMHGQMVSKWEVVQEVLPKQGPDAAKTNRRDGIGKCESVKTKEEKKENKPSRALLKQSRSTEVQPSGEDFQLYTVKTTHGRRLRTRAGAQRGDLQK